MRTARKISRLSSCCALPQAWDARSWIWSTIERIPPLARGVPRSGSTFEYRTFIRINRGCPAPFLRFLAHNLEDLLESKRSQGGSTEFFLLHIERIDNRRCLYYFGLQSIKSRKFFLAIALG